jgi:hypothetical protein
MSELKELIADAGLGISIASAYILAGHPDELILPNGWQPSPTRRTFILKLNNGFTEFVETVPAPLVRAWTSSNGASYCAPYVGNYIFTFIDNKWKKEHFSTKDEDIFFIWGFGGSSPVEDIVYLCANGAIYVRNKGIWQEHVALSGVRRIYHVHGLSPNEIYLCSDVGLLLWNERKFSEVEGPTGNNPKSICVLSQNKIIAAAKYLDCWSEASGWTRVKTEYQNFRTLLPLGNEVFAGTPETGVIRLHPGTPDRTTELFNCLRLCSLGNGILAVGKNCSYLYDSRSWRKLQLPVCRMDEIPQ